MTRNEQVERIQNLLCLCNQMQQASYAAMYGWKAVEVPTCRLAGYIRSLEATVLKNVNYK